LPEAIAQWRRQRAEFSRRADQREALQIQSDRCGVFTSA